MQAGLYAFWVPLGSVLHVIVALLVSLHCLMHKREAVSAVLWIFLAWSFPALGALTYVAFGIDRVPVKGWRKRRSDEVFLKERQQRESETMPLAYWRGLRESLAARPASESISAFNDTADLLLPEYPLQRGNHVTPLICGDEAYPRMLNAIARASHHIHLQTFIIGNDAVGRQFMDLLADKASQGVRVRFLYDRFGSTRAMLGGMLRRYGGIKNMSVVGWTQANPIKRQFQVNLRNHRKILVVDGNVAFAGGLNIGGDQVSQPRRPAMRDYHFAFRGPVVNELQYTFLQDWYFMTEEDPDVLLREEYFPAGEAAGPALVRVINGGPNFGHETLTDLFFTAITAARKEILAVTPYLVPTPDILRALRTAALRGVRVRVVQPRFNNHLYAGMAARSFYERLLEAGVRIYRREPPFIHAKALVVDDELALIGTANIDVRSLRLNYETNLAVYDADFVDRLKQVIIEDIGRSTEVELNEWRRRPVLLKAAENFCALLTPVL